MILKILTELLNFYPKVIKMSENISYRKLFKWFILEEYRVFKTLFGTERFLIFPLIIFIFSIILGSSVTLLEFGLDSVVVGYFTLIVLFGIQTGVVGFDAQDTIKNVLGEDSRILFASRTLPVSRKRLVAVFLLKDAVFYTLVILTPVVIGGLIGLMYSPLETIEIINISYGTAFILYIFTIISFISGVSLGFVLTTIKIGKNLGMLMTAISIGMILGTISLVGVSVESMLSVSYYIWLIVMIISTIIFTIIGLLQFKISANKVSEKNRSDTYIQTKNLVEVKSPEWLVAIKTITDIHRSPGGFWKVVFSTVIIAITGIMVIYFVSGIFGTAGIYAYLFAGLVSLIAYPLYTVIYRYDAIETYSIYPIKKTDVYHGKSLVYIIIGIPLSIAYYTPIVYTQATFIEYVTGIIIMISLLVYQLGLLLWLVDDRPIEFLFDGLMFSLFSAGVMIFIIPILIIGMYGKILIDVVVLASIISSIVALLIGIALLYYHHKSID